MKILKGIVLSCLLITINPVMMKAEGKSNNNGKLAVLWVSGDRDVAEKSCLMYTHAAKRNGWFDEVVLIVWGSSSRLLAEDKALQEKVKAMEKDGVILEACIACSDQLGVTEELLELGIDVKGMGVPLTNYLKEGYHVLTY
ncbi:MAG: DsrE family protein [Bacteroidales bacterium]|nr:DsrE family protein [Bacteroidales bacterium]